MRSTPFSVLDLAPVATGSTVGEALRNSLDLARQVERLGYRRHWVAEHHNMPGIASSAPAVLIAHLASVTTTLRVGSGGVMLPNHQPLVVAEQFGMLEALHPGRIDLGIGRAPGTDQITAHALRRSFDPAADDLPSSSGSCSPSSPGRSRGSPRCPGRATGRRSGCSAPATSAPGSRASSGCRSRSPTTSCRRTPCRRSRSTAATSRRRRRSPSRTRWSEWRSSAPRPTSRPGGFTGLRSSAFLRLRAGRPSTLPSPEEADAYGYSPDRARVRRELDGVARRRLACGRAGGAARAAGTDRGGRADPDDERV